MINGELRPTYLQTRGISARSRRVAGSIRSACQEWVRLARWLDERGIGDLGRCTEQHWHAYAAERCANGMGRDSAEDVLADLTYLWVFDQLCARPTGISQPVWETEDVDDFLPTVDGSTGGENSTEPLDPEVMGPLLIWALRAVEDFADDILAAWSENRRLTRRATSAHATPEGREVLEAYLRPIVETGAPIPASHKHGKPEFARMYVTGITGASFGQVDRFKETNRLTALAAVRPGSCPLAVPVTGRVNGRPWRTHLDFYEAPVLMRHLGTAAAIVCLYLTGMRPQEVQSLRSGCCPEPEPAGDGSPGRHLIRSRHYKNVTDHDGNHLPQGEEREVPWVAITPVVRAIRVLERIVPPGELLLSTAHHDFGMGDRNAHGSLGTTGMIDRIEEFIAWANREALAQNLPDQTIPDDPYGSIGMGRFRRTLAWHIARRPGGLIGLAVQYGHMRTILDARTSSGYGSRSRRGIHGVLDVETALAAAGTAARLRDRLAAGEKISGPATRRALTAAAHVPRFEGRLVKKNFPKQAAAFLARDGYVLYDNPDAYVICAFKHENALCEPDPGATAPRQYDCRPGCGNAVRTDIHARSLRERADEIDQLAAAAPEPVGRRLKANAQRLRATADTHDSTARPAEALA
nr:integrase [Streptomyces caniscabiei]